MKGISGIGSRKLVIVVLFTVSSLYAKSQDLNVVSGTLYFSPNSYVYCASNVSNSGTIELDASSSGCSQLKIDGAISNQGTMKQWQYLPSIGHHSISSPMASGFDQTSGNSNSLYTYNSITGSWNFLPTLNGTGTGYFAPVGANGFLNSIGNFSVSGTPNLAFNYSLGYVSNVAQGGSGSGWNLIGNPFTCGLDWSSVVKSSVSDVFYVWDPTASVYQYYAPNTLSGSYTASSSILSDVIPPMQSFWVQAQGANASVTGSMSSTGSISENGTLYKSMPENFIVSIQSTTDENLSDATWIKNISGHTLGFEYAEDAWKLMNPSKPNLFSSFIDQKLAINAIDLDSVQIIPIGFHSNIIGEKYKVKVEQLNTNETYQVFIKDNMIDSIQEITSSSYIFKNQGWEEDSPRFYIVFKNQELSVSQPSSSHIAWWYQIDNVISIKTSSVITCGFSVYRLDGTNVYNGILTNGYSQFNCFSAGVYIIRFQHPSLAHLKIFIL